MLIVQYCTAVQLRLLFVFRDTNENLIIIRYRDLDAFVSKGFYIGTFIIHNILFNNNVNDAMITIINHI